MNNMRVLVTGANGFIGRRMVLTLSARGYSVTSLVRDASAQVPGASAYLVADICSPVTDFSKTFSGIDTVVHIAALSNIPKTDTVDPIRELRKINVKATRNLALAAAANGVRRFVFISSVKVNGEMTSEAGRPEIFDEDDLPDPEDAYGISKFEAEQDVQSIAHDTGLEIVIVRPPLVYGPGVKGNFLNLMKIINCGSPLPLASITNKRSLIFVGNLVDALATCATHPDAAGKTYLVSDGEDVSTPELIRRTAVALGVSTLLLPFPVSVMRLAGKITGKSGAVNRLTGSLTVDSSKIRRELEWKPPFTMAEGLQETAKWFRQERSSRMF